MAKKRQQIKRRKRIQAIKAKEQKRIPTVGWYAIGGVVAIAIISGLFWLDGQGLSHSSNLVQGIEGIEIFPDPGRGHQNGEISYAMPIPPGGPHAPIWQNCGIYDEPIRTENALHSMEHGAVWIAYQPDLRAEEVEALKDLVRSERRRLRTFYLLAPNEDAPAPIVATAWRAQLEVESASDDGLLAFMRRFHVGPLTPEPGATCSGGIGDPM